MESRKYRICGHGCVRPGFAIAQLATHVLRHKEDDAMTGAATSRRSRIWSSHSSRGWVVEQGRAPLPHRSTPAGPCLPRADGGQPQCRSILFAMAGT